MSKHTPGPWKAAENATGTDIMIWSGAYPVAVVRDAHEKQANAKLLATAPQLLAALKEAVIHIRCAAAVVPNQPLHDVNRATGESLIIRGQADVLKSVATHFEELIAKAEGRDE